MSDRLRDVPSIPERIELDGELRRILLALRENVRAMRGFTSGGTGALGSASGGLSGGGSTIIVGGSTGGSSGTYVPDLTPPPTPTGVIVVAGIDFVGYTTDAPVFTQGHGYSQTIVYGATYPGTGPLPTFTNAVPESEFIGQVGSFASDPATEWHIWMTWKTVDGVESTVPAGGANGFTVTTGQDVTKLLQALTGQITESELYSALASRIDLIDAPTSTPGSVNARVASESIARTTADTALSSSISSLSSSLSTNVATLNAAMSSESTARANGDAANASQITTVQARVNRIVNYRIQAKGFSATVGGAGVTSETGASLHGSFRSHMLWVLDGATGSEVSWQFYDVIGNGAGSSGRNADTLTADLNALTADKEVVVYTYDEPRDGVTPALQAALKRCGATQATLDRIKYRSAYILVGVPGMGEGSGIERYAGDTDNAPNAWVDLQLQLVNGRPVGINGSAAAPQLSAAVSQEITARATETGYLGAQYNVRVQLTEGGRTVVGGFGIAGTSSPTAGPTIDFGVRADKFWVGAPAGTPGVGDILPFIVQTSDTVINGVTIPKGVYMDAAFIVNLTAMVARLGSAWITNAMVQSLSATKILAGSIGVGEYIQSSTYVPGSSGWRISGNGSAEFSFAMIRGTLIASQVAAGFITATMIGAGEVTATKINVTSLSAISATIGLLRTASSGARTEIADNVIRVYDSANVLRVKIGDLS